MQETWVQTLGLEDPLEKGMQPTPVFLPGESHGQRSLAGYSPQGCKELDMPGQLIHHKPFEKEMATCSSVLAWENPRTEEPSRLQSTGSQRSRT